MIIRQIQTTDAEQLVKLIEEVERTSDTMLYGAGERNLSANQLENRIKSFGSAGSTILVAEVDGQLVGYLMVNAGTAYQNRHTAYLVIGISEKFRGQGIGKTLFNELDKFEAEHNLHRLELTVMTSNLAAIRLYERAGFVKEGVKKDSLFVNGEYVDEYYMAKLF